MGTQDSRQTVYTKYTPFLHYGATNVVSVGPQQLVRKPKKRPLFNLLLTRGKQKTWTDLFSTSHRTKDVNLSSGVPLETGSSPKNVVLITFTGH